MKAYSQDLREKVIAAVTAGKQSNRKLAEAFGISESVIEKWTRRQRETGSVAAWPHGGGVPRRLAAQEGFLRAEVAQQPDISLEELCARLKAKQGVAATASMMCRELQRLKLPRKKRASTTANGRRRA
jgi:transposase